MILQMIVIGFPSPPRRRGSSGGPHGPIPLFYNAKVTAFYSFKQEKSIFSSYYCPLNFF
jgi:hypothetical protein